MIWKQKAVLLNVLITLNNADNMNKKLLKSREDFIEWKKYCENVAYISVDFTAEEEEEPFNYPCVMFYRDNPYSDSPYRYNLYYHFVYQSDFMA